MTYRKKLIEVALPLEAINKASAKEKSIRHGHPSTLHLWWSRKPLATCRAVLFASIVDDPSSWPEKFPTEKAQEKERQRLFRIIEELVVWENSNNERVLNAAKEEIRKSTGGNPPPVYDPFCGGGSIPLETQRLGLKAYASDLNPVAVLITKALVEIPGKFAGHPPINPDSKRNIGHESKWHGAQGLAEDIRYYGKYMYELAQKQIGQLYPEVKLPKQYGGGNAKVISWLYYRSIKCPNPACRVQMPLASKFWLSTKAGKQAWVKPIVCKPEKSIRYEVKTGEGSPTEGTVNRNGARCIACGEPVTLNHLRAEGKAKRMHDQLVAIVAEGNRQKLYLSPENITMPKIPSVDFLDDVEIAQISGYFNPPIYGYTTIGSMFNARQKFALYTFSQLVGKAKDRCIEDGGNEEYASVLPLTDYNLL